MEWRESRREEGKEKEGRQAGGGGGGRWGDGGGGGDGGREGGRRLEGSRGEDRREVVRRNPTFPKELPPPCEVIYMASVSISLIHMERERN